MSFSTSALLLLGHGSTLNADSSAPTYQHAEELRQKGLFAGVYVGFWKEEPNFRQALRQVQEREVFVVPNFISSGYFTEQIIPRELGLTGATSNVEGRRVYYCAPVGLHSSMEAALLQRATQVVEESGQALENPRQSTCLFICGHGTNFNDNSTKIIYDQADAIRSRGLYADCQAVLMEQKPFVKDWRTLTACRDVIVVPFFISDGLHSYEDIPVLLGLTHNVKEQGFVNPTHFGEGESERRLWYASAIGTEPYLADVIMAQVEQFINLHPEINFPDTESRVETVVSYEKELEEFFRQHPAPWQIGEVLIIQDIGEGATQYRMVHEKDRELAGQKLRSLNSIAELRELIRVDDKGQFRPLRAARNLPRGWIYAGLSLQDLRLALDYFYPGEVANWSLHGQGKLPVTPWLETAERQTGRFRIVRDFSDERVIALCEENCAVYCGKQRLWAPVQHALESARGEIPLICPEACNWYVGKVREKIKGPGEE